MSKIERPEALAQFAESARRGEREGIAGLSATNATEPIPTDPEVKHDAATRVLAEGATGQDHHADEAVDQLPDRIAESRERSKAEESDADPDIPFANVEAPYDATRDPRTGRPPTPLEAERLARQNEMQRLANGQDDSRAEERHEPGDSDDLDERMARTEQEPSGTLPPDQAPARMASPHPNDEEGAAIDELVKRGVSREWAEEIVKTHGTNLETLKAAARLRY